MSYVVLSIEHERDNEGVWVARLRIAEQREGESPRYWTVSHFEGLGWSLVECDERYTSDDAGAVITWADESDEVAELLERLDRTKPGEVIEP